MQSFHTGKCVWFDVSGIPGNTAAYGATAVQELKTGGEKRLLKGTQPESLKSSYASCFHKGLYKNHV